jgi:hemolysin activation/secretion protein
MKRTFLAVAGIAAPLVCGLAQGVDSLAPSSVTPKPVESKPAPPAAAAEPLRSPRNPEGDRPINPDQPDLKIKALILVPSRAQIQEEGVPSAEDVEVRDIPFLDRQDFRDTVRPFLGELLTENKIRDLEDTIILYCRERGRLLVDVILPEQNIENGVLQLWVLEGRVGNLTVKNEGRKWFKDEFILDNARLLPGETVDSITLTKDLNWLNRNPFRQVNVVFKPGDRLGATDVELNVEDRLPVRPYVGYDNSGTPFTGEDRLLFGFNWGNVAGLDHQLNYQYATDVEFDLVKAHSASYIAPLPWRHTVTLYGSHVDAQADFSPVVPNLFSEGQSWQISGRYALPLPDYYKCQQELSAGFDFKHSTGESNVFQSDYDTDVVQFFLGYSGVRPDPYGKTSVSLELFYSPGDFTPKNDDDEFNNLRENAKARYLYGRANIERITRLPWNYTWILNIWGQTANERLLPSEELAIGGYNTVRGYDERMGIGDNGFIVNNELRTPPFALGELVHLPSWKDQIQFLAFVDFGATRVIDPIPADGTDYSHTLWSFGGGLRYTVGGNFSLRFDVGFPLTEKHIGGIEQNPRVHAGLLFSY